MPEWLRKLLEGAQAPYGATPPFQPYPHDAQPVVQPPIRSSIPAAQTTLPVTDEAAPKVTVPFNVNGKTPPTTTTGNLTGPGAAERLVQKTSEYNTLYDAPAHKQHPAMQALWLAVQAASHLDPHHAQDTPMWLGEYKKQQKLKKLGGEIGGLQAQSQAQAALEKEQLGVQKTQADIRNTESQIREREYKHLHPEIETKTIGGIVYERPKGSSTKWVKSEGIEPPKMTKVKLPGGDELEVPPIERIRFETAQAEKEAQRAYETGKINSETLNRHQRDLDEWRTKESARSDQVAAWADEGLAKGQQARVLRQQAQGVAGTKEALDLETKAAELEAESQRLFGRARNSAPIPKPTAPTEFVPPATAVPGNVSRPALENRMRQRGLKPGSPEWQKVLSKAGF